MYAQVTLRRDPERDQNIIRTLVWQFRDLLNRDRQRCALESGAEVESLFASDPLLVKEEWRGMRGR